MENFNRKAHWENIYQTKEFKDVSWYQAVPETSLSFLEQFQVPVTARIIDVGGGDSLFVDHLLELGYENVTVLDISAHALERARKRLGDKAEKVTWIVSDISSFEPQEEYDFWHDRAVFHFLVSEEDIGNYLGALAKGIRPGGALVVGTFSEEGPHQVQRYTDPAVFGKIPDGQTEAGVRKNKMPDGRSPDAFRDRPEFYLLQFPEAISQASALRIGTKSPASVKKLQTSR